MRIRTALVTLLAIALFIWFLSRANLKAVAGEIAHARVDLIVWAVLLAAIMPIIRTVRWRYLLDPIGPTRFGPVLRATILGFAALALLPARAGDVLRPYLVARTEGLNGASVFATIVMERALDLVAVLTLLAAFVWIFDGRAILPPELLAPIQVSATMAAGVVVVLMAVMWTLATHPERIGRLVARSDRLLPHRVAHALGRLARTFSEGFAVAREPRDLAIAFVWSFPLWVTIALQVWLVTRAFGILIPLSASFLLQAMLVIGVAVPTPGGIGSFHEAYRIAVTTFFRAPNNAAVSAALVLHAVSFFTSLVPGMVIMAKDGLSVAGLGRLAGAARQEETAEPMKCPFCGHLGDKVVDSRESKEGEVIRRRRECLDCSRRFTSYERIDEIPYMVIKKDGTRERFERQKLIAGLLKACEKRPVSVAALEGVADKIEATLQERPEKEMGTDEVGRLVMDELKRLDKVAYVRFASVYRHFRDIGEFMTELKDLLNAKD